MHTYIFKLTRKFQTTVDSRGHVVVSGTVQSPVFSIHSSAYIVAPLWSFGKYSIHKFRGI